MPQRRAIKAASSKGLANPSKEWKLKGLVGMYMLAEESKCLRIRIVKKKKKKGDTREERVAHQKL